MRKCLGITIDRWGPGLNTLHASHIRFDGTHACTENGRDSHAVCVCRPFAVSQVSRPLSNLLGSKPQTRKVESRCFAFMNDAHNNVNARLGKKEFTR